MKSMEGAPKKSSKIEKGIRSALAGAAFLGAVGGAELPKEGGMPQMQTAEAQESFNANKEAEMFIAEIQSLSAGIDDARGRQRMQILVEEKLKAFALALKTRMPNFSAEGSITINGNVSFEDIERAKEYLRPKLLVVSSQNNPAVAVLKEMVSTTPLSSQQKEGIKKMWKDMGN